MAETLQGSVSGIAVRGLRELNRAFALAGKETRREIRAELGQVAEPVRFTATSLARSKIRRIGPKWSIMRTGISQTLVYVAPKQRGVKTRGPDPRRRPNLADLLRERALEPALARHEADIERRFERALDIISREWEDAA